MTTDPLIDRMVADLAPVRPRSAARDAALLGVLGAIELGLFLALGHARGDLRQAMALPAFWWKLGSVGMLSAVAVAVALRSFHPADRPRSGLRLIAALIGVSLALGWGIDAVTANGGTLGARLMWRHGIECVVTTVILSIPAIVALGLLMRRGAPTDTGGSALTAGIASATWGAFVFVFACPHDDPLYIALWYVIGCGIVALAARLILPRVTRW